MLAVDAITEQAAAFYEANGLVRLPDSLRMALPMRAIENWWRHDRRRQVLQT